MQFETVNEFLARGGEITKLPPQRNKKKGGRIPDPANLGEYESLWGGYRKRRLPTADEQ